MSAKPPSTAASPTEPALPTNILQVKKPFKNPKYKSPKKYKNLKQILAMDKNVDMPVDWPTYSIIVSPPSLIPPKKYCDITGLEAPYTDPKTGLRYHNAEVYKFIKMLSTHTVQEYLGLRGAAVVLK